MILLISFSIYKMKITSILPFCQGGRTFKDNLGVISGEGGIIICAEYSANLRTMIFHGRIQVDAACHVKMNLLLIISSPDDIPSFFGILLNHDLLAEKLKNLICKQRLF
jgi:hypothetical protein